jgi:hypothetical protein
VTDGLGRTMLVIGEDLELAVALRDRLDRAYVTVCEVRAGEAADALRGCHAWAWMVVGEGAGHAKTLVSLLARGPTLLLWRGEQPPGLPAHARGLALFSELAAAAEAATRAEVGGVRLAPGAGLTMPDGEHTASAGLEALVASHPRPLFSPPRHFHGVDGTLDSHGARLRVACTAQGGIVLQSLVT